jgi:hypothetical protein
MNNGKLNCLATIIKIISEILFLTVCVGCTNETLIIKGKVVDESGNSLSDVSVWACYSGWGWGEAGYLVWDKDYCSETTQTNPNGLYVITFKGPASSRLRTRKDGWVQAQDFNTTHSIIILTKSEDYSTRLTSEAKLRENKHRQQLPEESETEYYCRAILSKIRSVNMNYHGEILSITPNFLKYGGHSDALFALRGSSRAANSFSDEAVLKIDGETLNSNVALKSVVTGCEADVNFIGVNIPSSNLLTDARIEILVPSISAMFEMETWVHSVEP